MTQEAMKLALEALEVATTPFARDRQKVLRAQAALREALAEQPAQQCRTDGRCQYAIDSGAEGMGHCPKGKCVMPAHQDPAGWRPATFHRDNLTFNPGLPDEQTVKFWKLQGVEIEYCYTIPQPAQQEPVAWMQNTTAGLYVIDHYDEWHCIPLYTSPPAQRTWVGLTDEEIWREYQARWPFHPAEEPRLAADLVTFARAIEAAHGIKGDA